MKLLTKNSDYAVRALLELAKNKNDFISSRDIANKQKIPYHFLRKVLRELIRNNFVISKEGGSGGFKIAEDPAKIRIGKVIEALQGQIQLSECMFRKKICQNRSTCALRGEIMAIEKLLHDRFHGITIKRLLETKRKIKRG
jgi:Rrf2 family transcriptional regulator, cysteine metabolism repressor